MVAIIISSLQILKWLQIRYKYIKQPINQSLDVFMCLQGFPLQEGILLKIERVKQGKYISPVEQFD